MAGRNPATPRTQAVVLVALFLLAWSGAALHDGSSQVTGEAIVPHLIVLVRWTLDGSDRKAVLVRIIGGKKS